MKSATNIFRDHILSMTIPRLLVNFLTAVKFLDNSMYSRQVVSQEMETVHHSIFR